MSRNHRIAIVDDEQNIRLSAASILEADDYQVATFEDCESAIKAMLIAPFDTVFIDIKIGAESGLDLFNKMRALDIQSPVIFISGHASLAEVAQSLKLGAYDFIEISIGRVTKPRICKFEELMDRVFSAQAFTIK